MRFGVSWVDASNWVRVRTKDSADGGFMPPIAPKPVEAVVRDQLPDGEQGWLAAS